MFSLFQTFYESLIRNLSGPIGRKLRLLYYKGKFKSCGTNVVIEEGVYITNPSGISLGNNVWVDKNTILTAGEFIPKGRKFIQKGREIIKWGELLISDSCHIAPFSFIQAHGGVSIGRNVTIASGSKVYSLSHHYRNLLDEKDNKRYSFSSMALAEDQFLIVGNVIIGDNAAIGINSVILPGSFIPNGTWVASLSKISSNEDLKENQVFKTR
jgi:acetyltransferase-like isoleucine patch superfamily enzyme